MDLFFKIVEFVAIASNLILSFRVRSRLKRGGIGD